MRVARECAEDLAADGVVYAEVRFAPELHIEKGLSLDEVVEAVLEGFRQGSAGAPITVRLLCTAMRTAALSLQIAELAVRWRDEGVVRLRHRRRRSGLPADPAPRRVPVRDARELPHHDPRRRGVRPARRSGKRCSSAAPNASATACASSTTSSPTSRRRRRPEARPPGQLRPRPPRPARDVSVVERALRRGALHRRTSDRTAVATCASASRSTPTIG